MAAVSARSHDRMPRRDHVFNSVFPRTNYPTPTPEATPNIGSLSSPIRRFASFDASASGNRPDEAVVFSRAWSSLTRYLALQPGIHAVSPRSVDEHLRNALIFVLASESARREFACWYVNEINSHFRAFVRPLLVVWDAPIAPSNAADVLQRSVDILDTAQRHCYLGPLEYLGQNAEVADTNSHYNMIYAHIRSSLHSIIVHALPQQQLQETLASAIFQQMTASLEESSNPERCTKETQCHCQLALQALPLQRIHAVGLGGVVGERAFAHALHKFLQGPAIERRCFQVDWNGHSSVVPMLTLWVKQSLAPVVEQALYLLTGNINSQFTQNGSQQLVSMAISNLGRLRTLAIFDYIKRCPASTGAILDIREYLAAGAQADKAHVCQSFSDQVQRRLLHAGASTSEILSIYVNVINAFKTLDSRGVLLEKVAVPMRNYLRSREDTVAIIAASFLADSHQDINISPAEIDRVCPDITAEVANSTLEDTRDNKMLSWDDMHWMPDPIDAGPDYKSSKAEDVIAHILGLFEQDEFIKEITTVLAQHLLHGADAEYVKETRLVELFKSRLDPSKLQAAEVMLKDVRESVSLGKRINPHAVYHVSAQPAPTPREIQAAIPDGGTTLSSLYSRFDGRMKRAQFIAAVKLVATKRNDLFFAKRTRIPADPERDEKREGEINFKAQILSSFFWPQLRSDEFEVPPALIPFQTNYEERFHALGSQRKLHFRPALSRVSLKLDLEDRTVEEHDVPGWRASVIDVFASSRLSELAGDNHESASLRVEQIVEELTMDEELVQDALNYWVGKSVLYQRQPGIYAVLERLDMEIGNAPQPNVQPQDTISAVVSQDEMLRESAHMFETFIANMLRNQGPKQIGGMMGITNLLKMVLPTFTYGDDEVAWLLDQMERRGEVQWNGDVWAVVT